MEETAQPTGKPNQRVAGAPLPWEDPRTRGLVGLLRTVLLFITRPDEAFSRVGRAGLGRPFFYAVLMAWFETAIFVAYWFVFQFPFVALGLPELDEALAEAAVGTGLMVVIAMGLFLFIPFLVAIGLAIHTCILHLMLLIIGEGRGGFDTTLRALCYAHTADLANALPLCGGLISLVWFVALQIVGIARCHNCSYGKAALAVFLPILLCCSCLTLVLSVAGVAALAD